MRGVVESLTRAKLRALGGSLISCGPCQTARFIAKIFALMRKGIAPELCKSLFWPIPGRLTFKAMLMCDELPNWLLLIRLKPTEADFPDRSNSICRKRIENREIIPQAFHRRRLRENAVVRTGDPLRLRSGQALPRGRNAGLRDDGENEGDEGDGDGDRPIDQAATLRGMLPN